MCKDIVGGEKRMSGELDWMKQQYEKEYRIKKK